MNAKVQKTELVEAKPLAQTADSKALMALIERAATSNDFDLAKLEKLMDMKERWDANEARKAFVEAMADFKANPPEILKKKLVTFETQSGTTSYRHAELSDITQAILEPLAQHGFSHRWETKQLEGGVINVTCILTHRLGHSESVTLQSTADDSGKKNKIQAIASTITYLERYTLLAATGLATKGTDDDGRGSEPIEYLNDEQVANLQALIEEVGADKSKFLRYMKAEDLEHIQAAAYSDAVHALERKRK